MYRAAIEKLKKWKEAPNRKPLVIEGARQVGKTWLMKEFGRQCYENTVYINFDSSPELSALFEPDLDVNRIVEGLELYSDAKITKGTTLLIFDEVQEVPRALASLKYFYENAPGYHIVCAGSLLGIALHKGTSFPVGKTSFLTLYPLSFTEFLSAVGKEKYVCHIARGNFSDLAPFKEELNLLLKQYYIVGGMPEAVLAFAQRRDYSEVRTIQKQILDAYGQDFSKHAPADTVPKIRMVYNSIPSQLAKENRKFIYGLVREGGRAKEFENAIMWLCDCGLAHKVSRASAGRLPLAAYEDMKAFKLFLSDIGLLCCMTGLSPKVLLEGNSLFVEFKGALTEQYVLQQMKTNDGIGIYYYSGDAGSCEVDFLADNGEKVIPVEVKAEINLRAKSLKYYIEKFSPEIALRLSNADHKVTGELIDLPLYAAECIGSVAAGLFAEK